MALFPSPNFDDRAGAPIDMLILHYTGMKTAEAARARLCDPEAKVSAHYLIDEAGGIEALVAEENRAWHAGRSFWAGARDINARSIGIELVNPGHEFGYRPFPKAQMLALRDLAADILARHPIPPARVLGHSDVAPERKQDPGELFDWRFLAEAGIGIWPKPRPPLPTAPPEGVESLLADLHHFGYDGDAPPGALILAFCRHFRPRLLRESFDPELAAIARGLTLEGL